jgi:hypothetical protein
VESTVRYVSIEVDDPAGTGGPGEHLAVVGVDGEGDQPDLLRHRLPPAALHRSDHLDAPDLRHSRTPRLSVVRMNGTGEAAI